MSKHDFGNGELEFSRWETPFENAKLWVLGVSYEERTLDVHVVVYSSDGVPLAPEPIYRLRFGDVAAFRVLDEGGLLGLWAQTPAMGRPGDSTFRVRNHLWTSESILSFIHGTEDGWSFVIATDGECVEILAPNPPTITLEGAR